MPRTKCPSCGGFGSSNLGGYCRNCAPKKDEGGRSVFDEFPGYGIEGGFVPNNFGMVKDKFGIEER